MNDPDELPAATVTVPGTVTEEFPLDRLTAAPVPPAGLFSVTVQVADPGALTVAGAQVRADGWTGAT